MCFYGKKEFGTSFMNIPWTFAEFLRSHFPKPLRKYEKMHEYPNFCYPMDANFKNF